ncbi:BglG family transcription antiterminator [Dubosiella newyorkensis]|uniref:BglG family transcription antiterminator n=1 Tax=Dubosiella newyorkensis TaxID=1862672 RepID=UPI0027314AB0|nr:PRD domain-containing protein [Dubosiella newyorkensis]
MLGIRQQELFDLMDQNEFRSATYFSKQLNVSLKTVRNDIKKLDCALRKYGSKIESKPHYGYRLVIVDQEAFKNLLSEVNSKNTLADYDRNTYLLRLLLMRGDFIKIEDLCSQLYVSRTSITNSIRQIESILEQYSLSCIRKPSQGIRIEGEEFDIRRLLCYMLLKDNYLEGLIQQETEQYWLAHTIIELLNKYDLHLTEVALNSFINYVFVGINRMLSGKFVNLNLNVESFNAIGIKESSFSNELIETLENKYNITYTNDEKNYILLYLGGKQMAGGGYSIESDDNFIFNREIDQLSFSMIELIKTEFQINFPNNFELRMTLNRHLVPLDIRMRYGLPLTNPMIEEIKKNYSLAYDMAIRASSVLVNHYHRSLSEDEIGYLALIFALQLDKDSEEFLKKSNVLIVSNVTTSAMNLFKLKYEKIFSNTINHLYVSDLMGLRNFDFSLVDYVFTTLPLTVEVPKPIFEINSFMNDHDIQSIEEALWRAESNELRNFYTPKRFLTNISGDDKQSVLRQICTIIEEQEDVSDDFYDLVMQREEYPHMMYNNMIAMPHPNRICSAYTFAYIAILKEPIVWNDEMVKVVLLSSPGSQDSRNRQRFYEITAKFALNKEAIQELIQNPTFSTFIELLGI